MGEPIFTKLARHFISMQEPKVITIGDVIDSTVMHINKRNPLFARESEGNPHGTQGEPSNGDNSRHSRLLIVTLNLCTIIVFIRNRNLRKRSTYLVINLAVIDMLVGGVAVYILFY